MDSDNAKMLSAVVFVVFGILALWSFVTQETTFGRIYSNLFYLTIGLIGMSYFMPKVFEYQPVNPDRIGFQILAGFALGFALAGSLIVSGFAFSLLAPLSIPDVALLGILGFSAIGQVFIMSVAVSEFEETLRSATLRPSIMEWLQYEAVASLLFILIGVIIWFTGDAFAGSFKIIGLAIAAIGLLNFTKKFVLGKFFENKWIRSGVSIGIVGVFFSILHLTAYASTNSAVTTALMFNAFMYAVIADVINTYFESTVSSKIAHTLNNAAVSCVAAGVPIIFALIVAATHAGILYVTATGKMPLVSKS